MEDTFVKHDLILAIAATVMVTACAQKQPAGWEPRKPKVYMLLYNVHAHQRNPDFRVGDTIQLAAHKVRKRDELRLCYSFDRNGKGVETNCTLNVVNGTFHRNGMWSLEYKLELGNVGAWQNWVMVNGLESNKISYRVTR
jgi:hypothetical protein